MTVACRQRDLNELRSQVTDHDDELSSRLSTLTTQQKNEEYLRANN
jgi:hypothetical protein